MVLGKRSIISRTCSICDALLPQVASSTGAVPAVDPGGDGVDLHGLPEAQEVVSMALSICMHLG